MCSMMYFYHSTFCCIRSIVKLHLTICLGLLRFFHSHQLYQAYIHIHTHTHTHTHIQLLRYPPTPVPPHTLKRSLPVSFLFLTHTHALFFLLSRQFSLWTVSAEGKKKKGKKYCPQWRVCIIHNNWNIVSGKRLLSFTNVIFQRFETKFRSL